MITKQVIKREIDYLPDQYAEVLYKIIKALQISNQPDIPKEKSEDNWHQFVRDTYGCLSDDPIARGEQAMATWYNDSVNHGSAEL